MEKTFCDHEGYLGYGDGRQHQHPGPRGTRLIAVGRVRVCDLCGEDFCSHCQDGETRRLEDRQRARQEAREAREAAARARSDEFWADDRKPFDPGPIPQPSYGPAKSR